MYQIILPNGAIVPFSPENLPGGTGHPMPHMLPPGATIATFSGRYPPSDGFSNPHGPGHPFAGKSPHMTVVEKTVEDAAALLPSCLALLLNPKYLVRVSTGPRFSAAP
jgi:hypothetical protein